MPSGAPRYDVPEPQRVGPGVCDLCTHTGDLRKHPIDSGHYCEKCVLETQMFVVDDLRGEYRSTVCHVCRVDAGSPHALRSHCASKKHRGKLKGLRSPTRTTAAPLRAEFAPLLKDEDSQRYTVHRSSYDIFDLKPLPFAPLAADEKLLFDYAVDALKAKDPGYTPPPHDDTLSPGDVLVEDPSGLGAVPLHPDVLLSLQNIHIGSSEHVNDALAKHVRKEPVLGFDTETAPSGFFPAVAERCVGPHLLQLSTPSHAFLIELTGEWLWQAANGIVLPPPLNTKPLLVTGNQPKPVKYDRTWRLPVSPALAHILEDRDRLLVGFGIENDLYALRRLTSLRCRIADLGLIFYSRSTYGAPLKAGRSGGARDEAAPATQPSPRFRLVAGGEEGHTIGTSQVIARVFGKRFIKNKELQTGNWAVRPLTVGQVVYAARDALAPSMVYAALKRRLARLA